MFAGLVKWFDCLYEVLSYPDVFEDGPHVLVVEAGEGRREVEEQKGSVRVGLEAAAYCLVYVDDVG